MPIVRVDVPQGHSMQTLLSLKRDLEQCVARTWAKDHIYVAIREMVTEKDDRSTIMTVDLRPGRGREAERANALYREALEALKGAVHADPERFVLLIREFPEWSFVVDGGKSLPPLGKITPMLATK